MWKVSANAPESFVILTFPHVALPNTSMSNSGRTVSQSTDFVGKQHEERRNRVQQVRAEFLTFWQTLLWNSSPCSFDPQGKEGTTEPAEKHLMSQGSLQIFAGGILVALTAWNFNTEQCEQSKRQHLQEKTGNATMKDDNKSHSSGCTMLKINSVCVVTNSISTEVCSSCTNVQSS